MIDARHLPLTPFRFAPPKIFTNALLNNPEITTLIRDTEPHERALFSFDPSATGKIGHQSAALVQGRQNGPHGRKSVAPATHPIKQSAVSRALGSEMLREIRQSSTARHGGVNVDVLLRGAEKLCEVYSVAGAAERTRSLYLRHREVAASISTLENNVAKQQSMLDGQIPTSVSDEQAEEYHQGDKDSDLTMFTEEDLRLEEDEIRELEARKRELEDRVSGMQKDLGGLFT
jgi:hypothetical protein